MVLIIQEGKILLTKHPTVFIFFILSGIYFRKLLLGPIALELPS